MIEEWQVDQWEKGGFFCSLINKVNQTIKFKSRKEEVIYNRVMLGHSNLNSTH